VLYYADEGYISLYEGDRANFFESHYQWELAIGRSGADAREVVVPEGVLRQASAQRLLVQHPDLPFEVVVDGYAQNVRPRQAGSSVDGADVVEGYVLQALAPALEKEHDTPGIYVSVRSKEGGERRLILWGSSMLEPRARSVPVGDETWSIDLRRRRFALPFAIRLDDFRKEEHPGTTLPSSFESDVTQQGAGGERQVLVEMNQPLRDAGFVIYQSGWGPQTPGEHRRLYSQFAVVRNPSNGP
jgi:hypothetical protein